MFLEIVLQVFFYPQIKFDIFDRRTDKKIDKELAFDVEVMDVNDNAPKFLDTPIVINVAENSPQGECIAA